jgi:BirA family biotin operon repressor/biotin-[acetyl-CoA-carboxylase] ligase
MDDAFLDADLLCTATFVRHVEIHDTLGSTNDRAAELARDVTIELPALVVARRQTAGRGRGGSTWWSANGALTFSVLVESAAIEIRTQDWPQLSLATAAAVCDAISQEMDTQRAGASPPPVSTTVVPTHSMPKAVNESVRPLGFEDEPARWQSTRPQIKWPNDVYLDGRKVCGILIESPGGVAPAKDRLIIGIGINVNNSWRSAPHDTGLSGIALCDVTEKQHDLQVCLIHTLQAMQARYRQLACHDSNLPQDWQRLNWLTEQSVEVQMKNGAITGFCVGIDVAGALLVKNPGGVHRTLTGTVRVL